jgi:hypothetical protein
MRKDVREFIRRLEAVGLTVEPTPGHYRVLRDGKPLRKANGMPFTLPFSQKSIPNSASRSAPHHTNGIINRQTCANTSDQPCALTLALSHSLHSV